MEMAYMKHRMIFEVFIYYFLRRRNTNSYYDSYSPYQQGTTEQSLEGIFVKVSMYKTYREKKK